MIVFVRFNLGPGVPVELQEEASVAQLKEVVGSQQGVRPERLRVLFAGRELQSTATLQGCDLPEQSTVHVVLPPSGASFQRLVQEHRAEDGEEEQEQGSLTRLDLSSSRLPANSEGGEGRAEGESLKEVQAGAHSSVRTCSTFFVFCKSCRSIEPGKLRARCRRCKQTALTLSRGPSCWDDVLLSGRIHGICQSEGCQGNEAEFYMKCASHPTSDDDLSVALDLIMTNTRGVPCIACTDVMYSAHTHTQTHTHTPPITHQPGVIPPILPLRGVVLVFQCSERHVICLDCFQRYCQTRLNDRQFVYHPVIGYSLPCAVGCDDSLIKEVHHFRILGDEQYGRYLQYGAEECLLTTGGMMCPSPGCGAGLLPPDGRRRLECDRRLGCGFVFCRLCRGEYHEGACQAVTAPPTGEAAQGFVVGEEASLMGRWEPASLLVIAESTRPCPTCSVPVERNGGCMHMHCPLCKAEWCWLCGVPWNRECMGNHWFS